MNNKPGRWSRSSRQTRHCQNQTMARNSVVGSALEHVQGKSTNHSRQFPLKNCWKHNEEADSEAMLSGLTETLTASPLTAEPSANGKQIRLCQLVGRWDS